MAALDGRLTLNLLSSKSDNLRVEILRHNLKLMIRVSIAVFYIVRINKLLNLFH